MNYACKQKYSALYIYICVCVYYNMKIWNVMKNIYIYTVYALTNALYENHASPEVQFSKWDHKKWTANHQCPSLSARQGIDFHHFHARCWRSTLPPRQSTPPPTTLAPLQHFSPKNCVFGCQNLRTSTTNWPQHMFSPLGILVCVLSS